MSSPLSLLESRLVNLRSDTDNLAVYQRKP